MDERRTQIRERAGLEESRLNEDFIDFLRRWGTPVLLVLAVASVGWMLRGRYKANQETRIDNAFIELEAVRGSSPSPEQLIGVAEDYGDVRSVGMLARLEAADVYLESIRRGVRTGATVNTDGTLPKPEEALTEADRADYIQRAGDLYAQVLTQAQAKAGHEVIVVGALFGQASLAEMSRQWDSAKEAYQRAAEIADRVQYTGLASVARARIANLDTLKVEQKVYAAAEVPTIPPLPGQEPVAVPAPDAAPNAAPAPDAAPAGAAAPGSTPEPTPAPAPTPVPAPAPSPEPALSKLLPATRDRRLMTRPVHRRHKDEPDEPDLGGDDVADAMGFVLPGGRVDAEAVRKAIEDARAAKAAGADANADPDAAADADEEEVLPRVRFRLQHDLKKRLDKYLTDRITFMSRTQLQKLIDEGGATVNGRPAKASTFLRAGDVIEVVVPQPPDRNIPAEDIPLDVLYEDADIIVINKQPDIIVHPARSNLKGTMLSALAYHFKHRSPSGGGLSGVGDEFARPGVVHRLDRHTSGCIVFAKQNESHWKIGHQFEHRTVDKRYIALVQGKVEPDVQVIDLPIGPHPSREKGYRERYVVRFDDLGKNAVTICRVRERYHVGTPATGPTGKVDAPGDYTLVELELKTGRTHQIRVHLSYLGWPIVGDDMYGGKPYIAGAGERKGETIIARQALHACTLGFRHPVSNEPVRFTAPLRGDMASLVHDLRLRSNGGQCVDAPGATVDLDWATQGI